MKWERELVTRRNKEYRARFNYFRNLGYSSQNSYEMALVNGASCYWIEATTLSTVIKTLKSGGKIDGMYPLRQLMYDELMPKYESLINGGHSHLEACYIAVDEPASRFFFNLRTARYIVKNG